ncbi:MAG: LPS assembly lipoprotein LptE [Gammaproteobacteria bacterium]
MNSSRLLAVSLLLAVLGGCGFTLRGTVDLPPELHTLQIESPVPNSEIVREVSRVLRNNAVTLTDTATDDVWRLGIGGEQLRERVLSVNANARAGEYELTMDVAAQLRRGAETIGPETLSVSRVYLADPENAVAKNEEAELIRSEMRRELAQQILRRLQSLDLR